MSPRTKKGFRWFRWVAIVGAIGFGAKAFMAILSGAHFINTITANIAQFIGAVLIWGSVAFIVGWLLGGQKKDSDP